MSALNTFKYLCADFMMGGNGGASLFRGFSLDCIFFRSTSIPRSMKKMALSVMFPFLMLFTFMVYWALHALKQRKGWSYMFRYWIVTAYVVFYISYTSMTETLLKLVICESADNVPNVGDLKSATVSWHWMEDTDMACYSNDHLILLLIGGIPLTVVVFGAPAWLLYVLICHYDKLDEPRFLQTYGFFYKSYRRKHQYWEVVIMGRKALLFAIIAFSHSLGPPLQLLLALGILVISLAAHLFANPFLEDGPNLHMMEAASLSCSFFVFFVGLVFVDPKTSDMGRIITSIILVSSLIATAIYLVGNLLLEAAKRIDGLSDDRDFATDTPKHFITKVLLLGKSLFLRFERKLLQRGLNFKVQPPVPALCTRCQELVAVGGSSIVVSDSDRVEN